MPFIDRILDRIAGAFMALAAISLGVMLIINLVNIMTRSVFGHAFGWVYSWTLLLFMWMLLVGFFVYVRRRRDVVVDIFVSRLPNGPRITVAIATNVVGILVMLAILRAAPGLLALQTANMEAIALPIFIRSGPIFISAALILIHFANDIVGLLTGSVQAFPPMKQAEAEQEGAIE